MSTVEQTYRELSLIKLGDVIESVAAQEGELVSATRVFNAFVRYCCKNYCKKGDPDFDYCLALMEIDADELCKIKGLGSKSRPVLFKARKKLLTDTRKRYVFITAKWHFPNEDDCYEEVISSTKKIPLSLALTKLGNWADEHPNYEHDRETNGIIELTDWNEDGTQDCVRIEEVEEIEL